MNGPVGNPESSPVHRRSLKSINQSPNSKYLGLSLSTRLWFIYRLTETGVDYSDDDAYYPKSNGDGSGSGTGQDYSDNWVASGEDYEEEDEDEDDGGEAEDEGKDESSMPKTPYSFQEATVTKKFCERNTLSWVYHF